MNKKQFGANIHILSEDVIKSFEEKYDVHLEGEYIIFSLTYQNQIRACKIGEKFNVMTNDKTKLTIQPIAVEYWKDHRDKSLFRVQNAINKLAVFNQDITFDNISKELN